MKSEVAVGTLALSRFVLGDIAKLHSVYLRPSERGCGTMTKALRAVRAELESRGLGLRLETCWCWPRAVRFYLKNGFWLRSWKRGLNFQRKAGMPDPVIGIAEGSDEAWVGVEWEGRIVKLARALRDTETLLEHGAPDDVPEELRHLEPPAGTTLSLVIALHGWPLLRSEEDRNRYWWNDFVHPEALADRIQACEAWSVHNGWRVDGARIPGLEYPTWEELDAPEPDLT